MDKMWRAVLFFALFSSCASFRHCPTLTLNIEDYEARNEKLRTEVSRLGSWESVKAMYEGNAEKMSSHVSFRQEYVLDLLSSIRASGLRIAWPEHIPGSRTLTSDFDVPIWVPEGAGLHHWGDDVKAAKLFSEQVKKELGGSPGTMFDTNIYVKEFASPGDESSLYGKSIQFVAALTKVRRYMRAVDWEIFLDSIDTYKRPFIRRKSTGESVKDQVNTRQRFRWSNSNIVEASKRHTLFEKRVYNKLQEKRGKKLEKDDDDDKKVMGTINFQEAKAEAGPDRVLEAEYALYLEGMEEVRAKQRYFHGLLESSPAMSQPARDAKIAEIKRKISEAVYFAPEAYSSEGGFWHIVKYEQSGRSQEVWDKLTHFDLFCSATEQAGDFLKDVNHHFKNNPTTALYQSAKYLTRFYDAVDKLNLKLGELDAHHQVIVGRKQYQVKLPAQTKTDERAPDVFRNAVQPLLKIRKANMTEKQKAGAAKKVVDSDAFRKLFGQGIGEIQTTIVQHLAKVTAEYRVLFDLRPVSNVADAG